MLYPCPACGFEVFDDVAGSYDICPLCDWEDDDVQLRFPSMKGGANKESLIEYQQKILNDIPFELKEKEGYKRDSLWRPLTIKEFNNVNVPQTGLEYFDAMDDITTEYYWRK